MNDRYSDNNISLFGTPMHALLECFIMYSEYCSSRVDIFPIKFFYKACFKFIIPYKHCFLNNIQVKFKDILKENLSQTKDSLIQRFNVIFHHHRYSCTIILEIRKTFSLQWLRVLMEKNIEGSQNHIFRLEILVLNVSRVSLMSAVLYKMFPLQADCNQNVIKCLWQ